MFSSHLYAPVNDPAGDGTRGGIWGQEGMMEGRGGMRLPLETSLASRHVKVGAGRGRGGEGGEIRWCVGKRGSER